MICLRPGGASTSPAKKTPKSIFMGKTPPQTKKSFPQAWGLIPQVSGTSAGGCNSSFETWGARGARAGPGLARKERRAGWRVGVAGGGARGSTCRPLPDHRVPGAQPPHLAPETGGLVHLPQMHQLVQNHIIAHEGGCLEKAPVQRNRAAPRARTPARTLVAHGHTPHRQLVERGQFEHARWQSPRGQPPELSFDRRTQIAVGMGHAQYFVGEPNQTGFAVRAGFEPHPPAAEEDSRTRTLILGSRWAGRGRKQNFVQRFHNIRRQGSMVAWR